MGGRVSRLKLLGPHINSKPGADPGFATRGGCPNLGGSGGMPPQENFEKFTPLKAILKHFRLRFVSLKASLVTKVYRPFLLAMPGIMYPYSCAN